jgi:hypothetical protein
MLTRTDRRTGRQADRKAGRQTGRPSAWCTKIRLPNAIIVLKSGLQSLITPYKSDQFNTFFNITKMLIEMDKIWEKFVCVKENSRKIVTFLCTGI